ncbi:TolC family protein [Pontixanthobacter gangjinensis]|uniref:TolC family protein n=1 Tax=Christiangramia aestuarii TaxID=1028746 RepID=A0A7M3SWL9_9FLAO|nr:TolC family protein [Christiangramia aestuarii]MUP41000.1 TolC family protein [Christiangramia aestuarii]
MRRIELFILLFCLQPVFVLAQDSLRLDFNEYMAIVKKYHPLVKQAGLVTEEGDFKLMKARGNFDPKVEADLSEKEYKSTEYYNLFNAAFKIPTYYGLELNAKYESNSGTYLNPQNTVPEDGLYSAGISLDITNGLFLSERMSALKQAKIYRDQSVVKRDIMTAEVLYQAALTYFEWYTAFQEYALYNSFVNNAEFRLISVKKQFAAGDKPAVDTLEANIAYENRQVQLQLAELDYRKASLKLANFLWTENNVPLELTGQVIPVENLLEQVNELWLEDELAATENVTDNPKLRFLRYDLDMLEVEKRLKANRLLPDLDLTYNFLTEQPEEWQQLNRDDYKFGIKFSLPLFMRKERGELQIAKLALENSRYELMNSIQEISNKLQILETEIISYRDQREKIRKLASDYGLLVQAEQRKFELGDSSLFLVNNRENSFISARMKEIEITIKFLKSRAELKKLTATF